MPDVPSIGRQETRDCVRRSEESRGQVAIFGSSMRRWAHVVSALSTLFAGESVAGGTLQAQVLQKAGIQRDIAEDRMKELIAGLREMVAQSAPQQHFEMLRRDDMKNALVLARSRPEHRRECVEALLQFLKHPSALPNILVEATRLFRFFDPQPEEWQIAVPALIAQISRTPLDHAAIRTMRDAAHQGISIIGVADPVLAQSALEIDVGKHVVAWPLQRLAIGETASSARLLRKKLSAPPLPDRPYMMPFMGPQIGLETFYRTHHVDRWTRIYAMEGLSMLGEDGAKEAASLLKPSTSRFGNGLEHARPAALEALTRVGKDVTVARAALEHTLEHSKDPGEICLAALALSQLLPDTDAGRLLFRRIGDTDVLQALHRAMNGKNVAGVVQAIIHELKFGTHSPAEEIELLRLVAKTDSAVLADRLDSIVPILIERVKATRRENPSYNRSTCAGPEIALDVDARVDGKRAAIFILRRTMNLKGINLTLSGDALHAIESALNDEDVLVREAAARQLGLLGASAVRSIPKIQDSLKQMQQRPMRGKRELEKVLVFQETANEALRRLELAKSSPRP